MPIPWEFSLSFVFQGEPGDSGIRVSTWGRFSLWDLKKTLFSHNDFRGAREVLASQLPKIPRGSTKGSRSEALLCSTQGPRGRSGLKGDRGDTGEPVSDPRKWGKN